MIEPRPVSVTTADGWRLRGEHRATPDASAVVVLGHAMMVDRRTLDRPRGFGLASVLQKHGLETVLVDARGHGESGPSAAQGGTWSYDDIVRFDVPAMIELGRDIAGERPVVLLGHSLIGHAALIAAGLGLERPDKLVAYAPNLWSKRLEPSLSLRLAKGAALKLWSATTRARGYYDARGMGTGTDGEAAAYVSQLLAMWDNDALASLDGEVDYEAALARAELHVLAVSSEGDKLLARPESVTRFLALAENASIEHRVLRGASAPDHMGFVTSPKMEPLWKDTAEWILAAP